MDQEYTRTKNKQGKTITCNIHSACEAIITQSRCCVGTQVEEYRLEIE